MKPIIAKSYPYTAEHYAYVLVTSADGTVTEKQFNLVSTPVKLSLSTNIFGQLKIDSEYKMQKNSVLKNILDKNGEQIYTDGVWEIIQTAPILSALGTKEGYQYVATIISGDI